MADRPDIELMIFKLDYYRAELEDERTTLEEEYRLCKERDIDSKELEEIANEIEILEMKSDAVSTAVSDLEMI